MSHKVKILKPTIADTVSGKKRVKEGDIVTVSSMYLVHVKKAVIVKPEEKPEEKPAKKTKK